MYVSSIEAGKFIDKHVAVLNAPGKDPPSDTAIKHDGDMSGFKFRIWSKEKEKSGFDISNAATKVHHNPTAPRGSDILISLFSAPI